MSLGARRVLAGAVAAAGLLAGCASTGTDSGTGESRFVSGSGASQVIKPGDRKPAPSAEGRTLDDKPFKLADLKGKVAVVNFWASWCAPCRGEAPSLEKVHAETKPKGVEFIGVDIKDGSSPAKAFARTFKVTYPSLFDPDGRLTLAFRDVPPNAVPSTLILDRQGRIAARIIGSTTYSKLTVLLNQLLAEQ